ncbi:MAG: ROK family glucokinase [Lachnospiraceae bacterium]|nr:ROK family glucokinase [Lachnospiraceae bacterium]
MKYLIGIDVGGTSIKNGLFTNDGELICKWEIPTRTENSGENILPDIAKAIDEKLAEKNIDKSEVIGCGLGVPGPVNEEGVVQRAVNLGWGYFPLAEKAGELFGIKAYGANDANVAALGEAWKGAAAGYANVVMVTLGTGIGGGIIVNGKILTGCRGAGGEIGHMHVRDGETKPCGCGNYGCIEQYASATGIARLARERLMENDDESLLRHVGSVSAKDVFDAIKQGDEVAVEVGQRFGDYLGKALANIACVVNPDAIVIGGGVSKAGPVIFDYVKEPFEKNVFHACRQVDFLLAKLDNDAGIYGCAKLALDKA